MRDLHFELEAIALAQRIIPTSLDNIAELRVCD